MDPEAVTAIRKGRYPLRRPLNRADEREAETDRLALEESSGRDQFSLCLGMKFDASHRSIDLAFLNTSFAGIPATAPLGSSRNRRSASLSQRASQSRSISGSRLSMSRTARRARALAGSLRALDSTSRAGSAIRGTYHRPYPVPIINDRLDGHAARSRQRSGRSPIGAGRRQRRPLLTPGTPHRDDHDQHLAHDEVDVKLGTVQGHAPNPFKRRSREGLSRTRRSSNELDRVT